VCTLGCLGFIGTACRAQDMHACALHGKHAWIRGARSAAGAWVVANGRRVLNMVSLNFLGVAGDPVVNVRPSCPRALLVRHGSDGLRRL
jgi:hypothetical protein